MSGGRIWSTIVLAICLGGVPGSSLAATIRVVVYDTGRVDGKTIVAAEALARSVLLTGGVEAELADGLAPGTLRPTATNPIRIQILAHAPQRFPAGAIGFSLPDATSGIQIAIFADRVADVSRTQQLPAARVLGYAMAHELGHVLLKSPAHDKSGLMKAIWDKADWQRAAVAIIPFSADPGNRPSLAKGVY